MVKKPQILVTGGAGYLGGILIPLLLDEGFRVHVIDRFFFGDDALRPFRKNPDLRISTEDIFFHENIKDLFRDTYGIVHLASISNDPSCDLDPNLSIQTNFLATMSLARRAQAEGVRRFVFMSSCSVYGANGQRYVNERSATGPVTLYALTKLQCERELLRLDASNFAVTILRMATLFGASPRMRFDLAINAITKRALQGHNIVINGDGKQFRPFVHVKDASDAILRVLQADTEQIQGEIFNIGGDDLNYSIKQLAEEIHEMIPNVGMEMAPSNNDIRSYRVRFAKFQNRLGFEPRYGVAFGVKEIQQAWAKKQWPNMDDEQYYNVVVMKKAAKGPIMQYSLASAPRWSSKDPLLQSK